MTRIYVRRRAGEPLGPRPYAVERDGKVTLARGVGIPGPCTLMYDPSKPEGQARCWVETDSEVTVWR